LYRIDAKPAEGGGHTWPGAIARTDDPRARQSPPTQEISASELLWQFVKRHRLP
jgi:poly(3-hydroxybutyrate) depolymerase